MNITEEVAEFIGALAGDGFIGIYGNRKNQFMIQFAGHSKEDKKHLKHIGRIGKEKFKINFRFKVKGNCLWMYSYSKRIVLKINKEFEFPFGKKGNNLRIPETIKKSDEFTNAFIRGLFDTDDCVFFDKRKAYKSPYPRIRLEIVSQKLFKEIVNYLDKHFKMYIRTRNRPKYQKTYALEIHGQKQLSKWMDLIGFSNEKHLKKIYASVA